MSVKDKDLEYIHLKTSGLFCSSKTEKILLTGCGGFLGYYLTEFFSRYHEQFGISQLDCIDLFPRGKPGWLVRLADSCDVLHVHNCNVAQIGDSSLSNNSYTRIIHAASIASPSYYRMYPLETLNGNINGLTSIVDTFGRKGSIRSILFFSSSEVYGDPVASMIPTPESYWGNVNCAGPRSCYDEAKRLGETYCYVYANSEDIPMRVVRPFNNYGPGLHVDDKRLPADVAKSILANDDIRMFSDGIATRTFCYIADAIVGYIKVLMHCEYDCFNIGNDSPEISIESFIRQSIMIGRDLFGYQGCLVKSTSDDLNYITDNPQRRCPDLSKARSILGYHPEISLAEGMTRYLTHLQQVRLSQ